MNEHLLQQQTFVTCTGRTQYQGDDGDCQIRQKLLYLCVRSVLGGLLSDLPIVKRPVLLVRFICLSLGGAVGVGVREQLLDT